METELDEGPYIEDRGEPAAFVVFMNAYPKKENRDGALKEWWRIRPSLELEAKIMRSIKLLKQSDKWRNGFAPDAKNFLRDRRWKDAETLPEVVKPISVNGSPREFKHDQGNLLVSTPQSAKEALRQGVIDHWKSEHPGEEPPAGLLKDPIGYVTSVVKSLK